MRIIVFKDGATREITGEQGKYWLCGEEKIRRLSRQIAEIREFPDPETEKESEVQEKAQAPKEKKKTARKKKTEAADGGECGK